MTPTPLAGYNTAASINGAAVALTEWEVTPEVDDLDATNTESGGFHVALPGPVKCEITLTGFYDGSLNPFTIGTYGLAAGAFADVLIYVNANGAVGGMPFWSFPISPSSNQYGALVKSCQVKGSVKEKVMFTAHLVGSGEFVYPEGDVA